MVKYPHIALIDADLWCYDAAFAAQRKDEEGEEEILPFSYTQNIIDFRLEKVMEVLKCSSYEMYLTGKGNFRIERATTVPYKGNRKKPKPYHYQNCRNYLEFSYGAEVVDGMEADDMLAIRQTELRTDAVIVTRDKDLRMVEGWHYAYACGNTKEKDLEWIDHVGYLKQNPKGKTFGGGMKWFFAQCLMGDRTDNIIGVPKCGDVKAFKLLNELEDPQEMYNTVLEQYSNAFTNPEERLNENIDLLWMCRELDDEGRPVRWSDKWIQ